MVRPREIEIVRRAYALWELAGKPDGQDQEFYHQAERELTGIAQATGVAQAPDTEIIVRTPDSEQPGGS